MKKKSHQKTVRIINFVLISFLALIITHNSYGNINYQNLKWEALIPDEDLILLLDPPEFLQTVGEGSQGDIRSNDLSSTVEEALLLLERPLTEHEQNYIDVLKSTNVNDEYHNKSVRMAGFVVPVEFNDKQKVTEFFLVPYYGACIHLPPPPPNQIVYITYSEGLSIKSLSKPYVIEGSLSTTLIENNLAMAAYSMNADNIKRYRQ